jgi:Xaa-Pro dipeptidase
MPLHFSRDEFGARRRRACDEMAKAGLDGLLIFRQESMYWLTGYDTSGYSMFQGMYLRADGALALLTRSADLRQARLTSVIEDIRIWTDREGADPAGELRDMVADYGGRGRRIGVEYHAYGLTAQRARRSMPPLPASANWLTPPISSACCASSRAPLNWPICDRPGGWSTRPARCRAG